MSIYTLDLGPIGDTPKEIADQAKGRADAYDAHRNGTPVDILADRLEWMDDPRISGVAYSAAYLDGFRACLSDFAASQWWTRETQTDAAFTDRARQAVTA